MRGRRPVKSCGDAVGAVVGAVVGASVGAAVGAAVPMVHRTRRLAPRAPAHPRPARRCPRRRAVGGPIGRGHIAAVHGSAALRGGVEAHRTKLHAARVTHLGMALVP